MKQEEGIQRESDDKTDLIFGADAGHGAVAVPDGPGKGLCDRHFGRTGPGADRSCLCGRERQDPGAGDHRPPAGADLPAEGG